MSWLYRSIIRPALFRYDSEEIHNFTLRSLSTASRSAVLREVADTLFAAPELPVYLFGLRFPNPVGLAAGMDKHAKAVPMWKAMGFGFSELGGVTAHGQPGNDQPRMFRAVADRALINRMGFNNPGAEALATALKEWRQAGLWPDHPVGVNLGKSKITPLEEAPEDYATSFRLLRGLADFFVVNVSSPNTPNLRKLQDKSALDEIFAALQELNTDGGPSRPILVKIAPDLSFKAADEVLELAEPRNIAGVVATNTTIARPEHGPELAKTYSEMGGLSGAPLAVRSTEMIRHIYQQTKGELPVIGVGGIFDADDAWEKIVNGASLLQIYTGLVYEGPSITRDIVKGLAIKLRENGFANVSEAVGSAA